VWGVCKCVCVRVCVWVGCIALYKIVNLFFFAKPMMIFPLPTVSVVASSGELPKLLWSLSIIGFICFPVAIPLSKRFTVMPMIRFDVNKFDCYGEF